MPITTIAEGFLTGIREIDEQLVGGIRAGSLVLVEGPHDTGKGVLCQYLTRRALRVNTNAVSYYTTEHNVKSMIAHLDSLSLPTLDYLLADSFRIYPLRPPRGPRDSQKYIYHLTTHISKLPERFNLVIIDCITPFIARVSPVAKTEFFYDCKKLCNQNRTIILTANPHIFEKGIRRRISHQCDYHLTLKTKAMRLHPDSTAEWIIKKMGTLKLQGVNIDKRPGIRFEIKPQSGIQIIPLTKTRI